jgi:hypothetical protein
MPRGPKGEKRPADVIGAAVMVGRIATGEIDQTEALPDVHSVTHRTYPEFTAPSPRFAMENARHHQPLFHSLSTGLSTGRSGMLWLTAARPQ